jgi:DNA-binding PadR family transcriptional regulator
MDQASTLEFVLLGLLDQAPRSGYDLRRVLADTPLKRFSDSPGAIYPALRRLERRGWIAALPGPAAPARGRRALRLGARGRRAFVGWLRTPPTHDEVVWRLDDLKPRFAFMSQALSQREIACFLEALAREVDTYVGELEQYRQRAGTMSFTARLAFSAGIEEYRTAARWARRALARLAVEGRER